ncbi:amidohydrolase family protein [Trujillonella endophytica]|uniref:Predicted metal-dependent hydrolase, TIM-barrel fold n=1 Tax=Trujillonella endophytica TaxID=673521 RepID=A0A1H8SWS4_9ACTN|nr:amidohydrolase family protein [Trujillella endophytica]SEO83121.1 Predicted metal-dependent hydrolase, TIM-barrel fold [Trujillella endophytica]
MPRYDVVDSQLHLFHRMDADACLAVMDALGIAGVLIDEAWGLGGDDGSMPSVRLPGGLVRPIAAAARVAALRHPDRFRYLLRVDHRDPELASLVAQCADDPGCVALRAICGPDELADLDGGGYAPVFRQAARVGLPVFVQTIGRSEHLAPWFEQVPDCRFVIDHVGLVKSREAWGTVLRLAEHPNVSLKWCHANLAFPAEEFPYPPMQAALREAVDAFGPQRVLWASDASMVRPTHTWADVLFYVRECDLLTEDERAWVLGRAARQLLGWSPSGVAGPSLS